MGNTQTVEEAESVGYRVLGVQGDSPASNVGFVSFFDFIIAANSIPLRSLDFTFMEIIKVFYYIYYDKLFINVITIITIIIMIIIITIIIMIIIITYTNTNIYIEF